MGKGQAGQNDQTGGQPQKKSVFNYTEINSSLRSANLIMFFGFMLAGFFGLYFLKSVHNLDVLKIILLPALVLSGCIMMLGSLRTVRKIKKIGVYMAVIVPNQPITIDEISSKTNKNALTVRKDFTMFFKNDYLYGRIDETKNEVILTAGKH